MYRGVFAGLVGNLKIIQISGVRDKRARADKKDQPHIDWSGVANMADGNRTITQAAV